MGILEAPVPFEDIRSPAPEVLLQGSGNRDVALADTWRDRAGVFVFLRHFG